MKKLLAMAICLILLGGLPACKRMSCKKDQTVKTSF